jgi:hypothetical protein
MELEYLYLLINNPQLAVIVEEGTQKALRKDGIHSNWKAASAQDCSNALLSKDALITLAFSLQGIKL